MPTLANLEAAASLAIAARDAARDRLAVARQAAQHAIAEHATIQSRYVTGAGVQADVDQAAATRDSALAALQVVVDELDPDASAIGATAPSRLQTPSPK
jgi:hypothetical protein